MANLLLTDFCNLRCPYCFAQEEIGKYRAEISLINVRKYINFIKKSNLDECRLMGGEPTLHSRFPDIIKLCLKSKMGIHLFSNGIWAPGIKDILAKIPKGKLAILLNINHPSLYNTHQWKILGDSLSFLSGYFEGNDGFRLSLNIFETNFEYQYIVDLAHRYNINTIRFSPCAPLVGHKNYHIAFTQLKLLGHRLMKFVREAKKYNIYVANDCGTVPCMFTHKELGELTENLSPSNDINSLKNKCKPVIDIGIDLMVWRCFPTSGISKVHLSYFNTLKEITEYFEKIYSNYQCIFPDHTCYSCSWAINGQCRGGCLAHTINLKNA